jgi:hypothetical protein
VASSRLRAIASCSSVVTGTSYRFLRSTACQSNDGNGSRLRMLVTSRAGPKSFGLQTESTGRSKLATLPVAALAVAAKSRDHRSQMRPNKPK